MLMQNTSGDLVSLPALGIPPTGPGECVEIEDALCIPGRADNGSRKKSPIEMYAPQLAPADELVRAEWKKIPPPRPVTSRQVTSRGPVVIAPSLPPGVRAAMAAKAAADAPPVLKPATLPTAKVKAK